MLFYSYAELIIGLVAIFYFTSKNILYYQVQTVFCPVIDFYNFNGIVCLLYKKRPTVCNSAGFAFCCIDISSDFTGIQQKDDVDILFSVLFGINIFYLYYISIIMFNFTYKINHSKFYRL